MDIQSCDVALKEWAVICHALHEGRQVILLRKGGILDEDGVFALEHKTFWLMPTCEHQDTTLVKPEHRDLFETVEAAREQGENKKFITLRWLAVAEHVLALTPDDEDLLRQVEHIWTHSYLDLRFGYKPHHPLLCVVLRVYEREEPVQLPMQDKFFGCRSWIELETPIDCQNVRPVLDDETFAQRILEVQEILSPGDIKSWRGESCKGIS